jgi:hypothetical protein
LIRLIRVIRGLLLFLAAPASYLFSYYIMISACEAAGQDGVRKQVLI